MCKLTITNNNSMARICICGVLHISMSSSAKLCGTAQKSSSLTTAVRAESIAKRDSRASETALALPLSLAVYVDSICIIVVIYSKYCIYIYVVYK